MSYNNNNNRGLLKNIILYRTILKTKNLHKFTMENIKECLTINWHLAHVIYLGNDNLNLAILSYTLFVVYI